jgi:hypothetical protein
MPSTPIVFLSYSYDNPEHIAWVRGLGEKLLRNGVEVFFDGWDAGLGKNLPAFMERATKESHAILCICTDNYIHKSDNNLGGVGYEKNLFTSIVSADQASDKLIPCIRNAKGPTKTPAYLTGRSYIDFSEDKDFEQQLNILLRRLHNFPEHPKPPLGQSPFISSPNEVVGSPENKKQDQKSELSYLNESSTIFFERRFVSTFPGVRGIRWFEDPEVAVKRLKSIFSSPYVFKDQIPIWWWRSGDMHIDKFEVLSPDTILIDNQELVVEKIAAVNPGAYYQNFIYIECKASEPTGIYNTDSIEADIRAFGYSREEFAIFQGRYIKLSDWEDGATELDGEVVPLDETAVRRCRYVSRYNLIIAPLASPINNNLFDSKRDELLDGILRGDRSLEEFVQEFRLLPKYSPY